MKSQAYKLFNALIVSMVLLTLLFFCLPGCSTSPMININWNSRIGNYSFDDMVSDYGQPWKDHPEPNGTRLAIWPAVLEKNSEWEFHAHHGEAEIDRVELEKPNVYYEAFYWMRFDSRGLLQSWEKRNSDH